MSDGGPSVNPCDPSAGMRLAPGRVKRDNSPEAYRPGGLESMQLNPKRFALALGVLSGLTLFLVTLVAAWRGAGDHLAHLSIVYIGYEVSYLGSAIGLVYGFLSGAIAGFLFSVIYNGSLQRDSGKE